MSDSARAEGVDPAQDNTPGNNPATAQAAAAGTPAGDPANDPALAEATNERVREAFEVETGQGFRGMVSDPTPNDHYTVGGVTSDKPTPETDRNLARAARDRADLVGEVVAPSDPAFAAEHLPTEKRGE